jgi:hypothetical protein
MTWSEFDISTALERDVLWRALPLVATESTGESHAVVDMGEPGARMFADVDATIFSTFHEVVGPNPGGCVDLLQIRPLLVGTAWKVARPAARSRIGGRRRGPRSAGRALVDQD